jgi:hypothetical protein
MRRKLVLVILLAGLCACSPKLMIMQNGAPVPNNSVRLTNDSSGLTVQFNLRVVTEQGEDSYDFEFPDFNEKVYISKDVKVVALDLWVYNPKGHKYVVNKLVETRIGSKLSKTERAIYEGREKTKKFQLTSSLEPGVEVRLGAIIRVGKLPLFFAGEAWYKVRKEVRGDYYDDYRQ